MGKCRSTARSNQPEPIHVPTEQADYPVKVRPRKKTVLAKTTNPASSAWAPEAKQLRELTDQIALQLMSTRSERLSL